MNAPRVLRVTVFATVDPAVMIIPPLFAAVMPELLVQEIEEEVFRTWFPQAVFDGARK